MKKGIFIIIIIVLILVVGQVIYTCYNNHNKENKEYNPYNRTIKKVSMKIKENTLTKTSATIVITDENTIPYFWGESYIIEKNIFGNWWTKVPLIAGYSETPMSLRGENGITEMKIDWSDRYGELKEGKYRIVKYANEGEIYAEFTIE